MFGQTITKKQHEEVVTAKDAEITKLKADLEAAQKSQITQAQLDDARAEVPEAAQTELTQLRTKVTELETNLKEAQQRAAGGGNTTPEKKEDKVEDTPSADDHLTADEKEIMKQANQFTY